MALAHDDTIANHTALFFSLYSKSVPIHNLARRISTSSDFPGAPDPPANTTRPMRNSAAVVNHVEHVVWRAQLMVSLWTIISLSIGVCSLSNVVMSMAHSS